MFAGEAWEGGSGLYYNRARWLDVGTGRFVSEDPWGGSDQTPTSLHKYLYTWGNPVSFTDPSGKDIATTDWSFFLMSMLPGAHRAPTSSHMPKKALVIVGWIYDTFYEPVDGFYVPVDVGPDNFQSYGSSVAKATLKFFSSSASPAESRWEFAWDELSLYRASLKYLSSGFDEVFIAAHGAQSYIALREGGEPLDTATLSSFFWNVRPRERAGLYACWSAALAGSLARSIRLPVAGVEGRSYPVPKTSGPLLDSSGNAVRNRKFESFNFVGTSMEARP
ncbi:MAG TPA: RHS repeat-associated core domain-containing protein [Myxococcales bacterium]